MTDTPSKQALEAARKALSAYEALIDPVYSVVIEEVATALDAFGKWYAHDLDQARKDAWAAQMAKLYANRTALRESLTWALEFIQEPEWFPNEGDRQWWQERRASITALAAEE